MILSKGKILQAAIISLVCFIAHFYIKTPFLNDNFLISDDLIFIPKWSMSGFEMQVQGMIIMVKFWSIISNMLQDPAMIRIFLLLILSLSFGIFAFALLHKFSAISINTLAVLTAVIPMGVDQAIFIIGSYPIIGISLLLIAFAFVYIATQAKNLIPYFLITIGYTFLTLAISVHPIFLLTPPAFIVFTLLFKKKIAVINFIGIIISYAARSLLMLTDGYHYSQLKGWVDYQVESIIIKATSSIKYIFSTLNNHSFYIIGLLCFSIIFFLLVIFSKKEQHLIDRSKIVIAFFFLLLGLLTFIPTLTTHWIQSRYFYAPQFFIFISVMVFCLSVAVSKTSKLAVNIIFVILCLSFYSDSKHLQKSSYTVLSQTQKRIGHSLSKYYSLDTESSYDQLVVIINTNPAHFTYGFNHWSTWFLRYLTGNSNLIGLVGTEQMCSSYPIVEKYADHNNEYWGKKTINGKPFSYRISMKGLEVGRKTFVFQQTDKGFTPVPSIVIPKNSNEFYMAELGTPLRKVLPDHPALKIAIANGFVWPVNSSAEK